MKRKPIMLLLALMLCVSAFALPVTAYADAPAYTTPPRCRQVQRGCASHRGSDAESGGRRCSSEASGQLRGTARWTSSCGIMPGQAKR
jgi:hypothetical protein